MNQEVGFLCYRNDQVYTKIEDRKEIYVVYKLFKY